MDDKIVAFIEGASFTRSTAVSREKKILAIIKRNDFAESSLGRRRGMVHAFTWKTNKYNSLPFLFQSAIRERGVTRACARSVAIYRDYDCNIQLFRVATIN